MRDGSTRRRARATATTWTPERVQVRHWRQHHRLDGSAGLADSARGLAWSRGSLAALLDELHVSDEFDRARRSCLPRARQPVPTAGRHRAAPAPQLVAPTTSLARHAHRARVRSAASRTQHLRLRLRTTPSRHVAGAARRAASALKGVHMLNESPSPSASSPRGHRVRELVCGYRSLRDSDGRVVDVPTVALNRPAERGVSARAR